jgi:hypothetical protein
MSEIRTRHLWCLISLLIRYVDHNNSGLVDANEIMRALRMWNLPFVPEHVEQMVQQMDTDDDGFVNYREFIDAFARGSTAMASVGRSDVWTSAIAAPPAGVTGHLRRTLADSETLEKMLKALRRALHAHFPAPRGSGCDPFAAFQAMDAAHKGTIDRREMAKALKSFKVPHCLARNGPPHAHRHAQLRSSDCP